MRLPLFAAAAFAPLVLAAAPAHALDITSERKEPVATSASGDVNITTAGSISPAAGPALTLDSNNAVSNAGIIGLNNVSNSTAVVIQGGRTGSFINSGTISNIEDFNPKDDNNDGVFEAPLASGSARFGVQVTGTGAFTGVFRNTGSIFVEGNDSAGVLLAAPLQGTLEAGGTIGVTGDRAFGIRTTAPVSGDITVSGAVATSGQASTAVSVGGDVGGALRIYSGVSSNAYATGSRAPTDDLLRKAQSTPSETQQTGPAVSVEANLGQGLFVGAAPAGTASGSTADNDGDGVADGSEGAGSISVFGSAPAVRIGAAGRDVNLGAFGAGANAYGMILRGSVGATGLYDGVSATGVQIGGLGGAARLAGGMRVVGVASASAYEADATAVRIGAGGVVPELRIENGISATIQRSTITAPATATATGVLVDAGGSLSTLTNLGTIAAAATGPQVSAAAVVDASGTLATVDNQGVISATLAQSTSGEALHGRTVALDLRANTSGVYLRQAANPSPIPLSATVDAAGAVTVTSTTPTTPAIVGDVLLGSGPNKVELLAGSMTGALDLGSAASTLTIGGGASYSGFLSHSGGALAIDVAAGSLNNTNPTPLQATSLNVGGSSTLTFAVDPANGRASTLEVSGPATIANGAKIGVNLVSNLTSPQTFALVRSPQLSVGGQLNSLLTQFPYVTLGSLSLDQAAGTLSLSVRARTAEEIGLNAGQSAALNAVYAAVGNDTAVQGAIFGQLERSGFIRLYDQMLPDYGGGVFRLASLAARTAAQAGAERGPGGAWVTQMSLGSQLDRSSKVLPYRGLGFGLAGGLDRQTGIGAIGVTTLLYNGEVRTRGLPGDSRNTASSIQAGVTWRADMGALRLDAQGTGGYVRYSIRRQFIVTDENDAPVLTRNARAHANGWTMAGRLGASYRKELGRLFVQPQAHVDYFRMTQGAYTEEGGGGAFDLAVQKRTGDEFSGSASLRIGAVFGNDFQWRPEIEVGYRQLFSSDPGITTASFAAGGETFNLAPAELDGGGAFARFALTGGDDRFDFSVGLGAETRSDYVEGDVNVRARFLF